MGSGVLKKLSALSYEILQFERDHEERYKKLVEAFNELQDEILKSKER